MSDSLFDLNFTILGVFLMEYEESRTRFDPRDSEGEIHNRKAIILFWERKSFEKN